MFRIMRNSPPGASLAGWASLESRLSNVPFLEESLFRPISPTICRVEEITAPFLFQGRLHRAGNRVVLLSDLVFDIGKAVETQFRAEVRVRDRGGSVRALYVDVPVEQLQFQEEELSSLAMPWRAESSVLGGGGEASCAEEECGIEPEDLDGKVLGGTGADDPVNPSLADEASDERRVNPPPRKKTFHTPAVYKRRRLPAGCSLSVLLTSHHQLEPGSFLYLWRAPKFHQAPSPAAADPRTARGGAASDLRRSLFRTIVAQNSDRAEDMLEVEKSGRSASGLKFMELEPTAEVEAALGERRPQARRLLDHLELSSLVQTATGDRQHR